MSKKLVLLDGNSLLYRAFYALPLLHNEKGVYTNAVYGFSNILLRIIEKEKPTHILVAFDAGKTTFRHSEYKEYKGKIDLLALDNLDHKPSNDSIDRLVKHVEKE